MARSRLPVYRSTWLVAACRRFLTSVRTRPIASALAVKRSLHTGSPLAARPPSVGDVQSTVLFRFTTARSRNVWRGVMAKQQQTDEESRAIQNREQRSRG